MKIIYLLSSPDHADASRLGKAKSAIIKLGDFYRYEIISENPKFKFFRGSHDTAEEALSAAYLFLSEKCDRA